jgi:cysteinyl-tRNA synthetase
VNLQFHNTFTRRVEAFRPLTDGRLGIYVCGPTVYAAPHLGHARSAVVFDVFRRFFESLGNHVVLVRNITDIDDKIIQRARERNTDYRTIAKRYHRAYDAALNALNVRPPHAAPRATDYIGPCQDIIARLLQRGHAYPSGGSVYFASHSCRDYGRLSGRPARNVSVVETRYAVNPDKRHPDDFALWKESRDGEPFWYSPWGPGRPGWHIECTAMSHALLGLPFDIHGGGCDLIFPHHENEIAQSLGAFGTPPAALWLHHGMVTVGEAKMAKSRGNAPPLEDLLKAYPPEAVRLFLLSRPYRSDLPFSQAGLNDAASRLDRLYALMKRLQGILGENLPPAPLESPLWQRFSRHMASDGDISGGLAALAATVREINRVLDQPGSPRNAAIRQRVRTAAADLRFICRCILGVLRMTPDAYARERAHRLDHRDRLSPSAINALVARRQAARHAADWPLADRLRKRLEADGVRLRDHDHATVWRQGKRKGRVASVETSP